MVPINRVHIALVHIFCWAIPIANTSPDNVNMGKVLYILVVPQVSGAYITVGGGMYCIW